MFTVRDLLQVLNICRTMLVVHRCTELLLADLLVLLPLEIFDMDFIEVTQRENER